MQHGLDLKKSISIHDGPEHDGRGNHKTCSSVSSASDSGPMHSRPTRRDMLASAGAAALAASCNGLALAPSTSFAADAGKAFGAHVVRNLAADLAKAPFRKPTVKLPKPLSQLSYDQYRDVRFKPEKAIWRGTGVGVELQLFSVGFLYDVPVEISVVEDAESRQLPTTSDYFNFGPLIDKVPSGSELGFSGFRIHGPLNSNSYYDEYAVFQGASYFRLVAKGQVYGLSARGLAINTAQAGGEEFPFFRAFWIEKPKAGGKQIVVHALLDSESLTGAYRFVIRPGVQAVMDVFATIYPRRDVPHVGIAPLTSMFLHGPAHNRLPQDFRPSVHDSEGLAMTNGAGEQLWRPLTNPRTLQISAFADNNPKGFGLAQRDRSFANFEDLEARYEKRPTLWIEPKGKWGKGFVELVEIPTKEEIHDNIVAYWKLIDGLRAQKPFEMAYRLHWANKIAAPETQIAKVHKTRFGNGPNKGSYRFVVDFVGETLSSTKTLPTPKLNVFGGTTKNLTIQPHPETKGVRVSFILEPADKNVAELRLNLAQHNRVVSEVWLYRWTRS